MLTTIDIIPHSIPMLTTLARHRIGSIIGVLTVSDPDSERFEFTVNSDRLRLRDINATTAQVILNAALDYEVSRGGVT